MKKNIIAGAILGFTVMLGGLAVNQAAAQDKVKYCKNAQTGDIITVEVNMPCPFPTHKI
jgi:hypothetical protein